MEKVLLDQVIETDYGQFDLIWSEGGEFDGNFDRSFAGQVNGLVGASSSDGVYINLGRRSGGSPIRIILRNAAPQPDDLEVAAPEWEDIVEVSFVLPEGRALRWTSWAGMDCGPLAGIAPGSYRLRVSAKGRDQGRDGEVSEEPLDYYLIELWPAPSAPDVILRVGSDDAQYWHREIGGRR